MTVATTNTENDQAFSVSKLVAVTLEKIIDENLQRHLTKIGVISQSDPFLKFQSSYEPDVAIDYYIARVAKYSKCSESCLVIMLIYIDRLIENKGLVLTKLNVHRMIITSLMVAAKYHDDLFYNNTYFAKLGGIPIGELNALEVDFLHLQSFSMFVATTLYEKYSTQLQNYKFFMQQAQQLPSSKALSVVVPPRVPLTDSLSPMHISTNDLTTARGCDNAFQFSPHRGIEVHHQHPQHTAMSYNNAHNLFFSQQPMDSSNSFAFSPASDTTSTTASIFHRDVAVSSAALASSWFTTTSSDSTAAMLTPTSVCHPHHHLLNGAAGSSFDFASTSCSSQKNASNNVFEAISRSASHDSVMSTTAPSSVPFVSFAAPPASVSAPVFASHATWPASAGLHHPNNHQHQQHQMLFHPHPHHHHQQHHLQTVTPLSSVLVAQDQAVGPFYHHHHTTAPLPSYFAAPIATVNPSAPSVATPHHNHAETSYGFGLYNHPAAHAQQQLQQQIQQQHHRLLQQQQQQQQSSFAFTHSLLSSRLVTVVPPPAQQLLLSVGF